MKRLIAAITFFASSSLFAVMPTQAQERAISANVPFDFVVGDRVLPPGSYRIASIDNSFQVFIDGKGRPPAAFAVGSPREKAGNGESRLVFDKIGDRYFLKAIVSEFLAKSLDFPESKAEKKARNLEGSLEGNFKTSASSF
jgi:hypothetical protein